MTPQDRRAYIQSLPLADLHRHFDGSVRPETLWEMSEKYYSAVPGLDFEQFRHYLEWDDSLDPFVDIAYDGMDREQSAVFIQKSAEFRPEFMTVPIAFSRSSEGPPLEM